MDASLLRSLVHCGAISRRDFVRLAVAGGMSVAAASTLFATASRAAEAPKQGGRFRLGVAGANTGDSHDPRTWGTSAVVNIGFWGAVYNNLMEIAPDGRLIPELAESAEPSDDAKTWSFKIRPGVQFHNGKTLDASDVVASLNHHRGADSQSGAKAIVDPIADIRADGANVVVVELKEGNADFPYLCTDYHLVIGPSSEGKIDWEAAVGTGGYTLVSHDRGVRMELKRNPGYWKQGRAHFDEVELVGINDTVPRHTALLSGAVDAIGRADVKSLPMLQRNPEIVIEEVTGTQHYTMPMFTDAPPFNDNNVRMALKHAVDRKKMVQIVLGGHGIPGNDHPITPANRFYASDIPVREYDPDKAKHYLQQAGMSSLKVDLSAADAAFVGALDTALIFKESARKAGIEVNVVREPDDGYWTNVWTKKPFVMCYWAGRPTEDWMFSTVYARGAAWNDTHWDHERFNQLLLQARAELDEQRRRELYHDMQLLLRDEGGVIVPMYANFIFARSNKVARGEALASNWELDGWKCVERWWFA